MARNKRKSQRDRRRYHVFRDQHGRKWGAVVEIDSGHPTGPITPQGWRPPHASLLPPAQYVHTVPDELGLLTIDYDTWVDDLAGAAGDWEDRKLNYAQSMYGEKASEAIKNPPPELLRLLGPRPLSVDVPRCLRAGNRWALGLSDKKPAWAHALFPDPVAAARLEFPDADEDDGDEFTEDDATALSRAIREDEDDVPECPFCQEPATAELSDGTAVCEHHFQKFSTAEAEAQEAADKAASKGSKRQKNGRFARQEA